MYYWKHLLDTKIYFLCHMQRCLFLCLINFDLIILIIFNVDFPTIVKTIFMAVSRLLLLLLKLVVRFFFFFRALSELTRNFPIHSLNTNPSHMLKIDKASISVLVSLYKQIFLTTFCYFILYTSKPTHTQKPIFVHLNIQIMLRQKEITSLVAISQQCPTFRCREHRIVIFILELFRTLRNILHLIPS